MKQTNIGIIGCGNISNQYAETLNLFGPAVKVLSQKADPYHAVHVIEILEAIQKSIDENTTVKLNSSFGL